MKFVNVPENLANPASGVNLDPLFVDERWQTLGDMIPDGLILVDRAGIVRYINSAAESITETARQAVVGQPLGSFLAETRLQCADLIDIFARGGRVNKVVTDQEGRSYALSTRSHRQRNGENNCFLILLRNLNVLAKIASQGESEGGNASALTVAQLSENASSEREPVIVGESTTAMLNRGLRAISMGSRLLVLGESGVGKTELARLLHRRSGSNERPFVHVNCGSIPESLFESEMFGYERGSFTGALARGKKGLIEAADGGTLFLDEVGEIPLHCQAKMLQVLEEGLVQRVGATAPRKLRLQIIAATNRDLQQLVEEGHFRRDLFYRLSVVTLHLPPLRQRPELIPPLLERFLADVNRRRTIPLKIDANCRSRLACHAFPGNIRELENIVEHLAVVCDTVATIADLPFAEISRATPSQAGPATAGEGPGSAPPTVFPQDFDLRDAIRKYESQLIDAAIKSVGSKRKAAELLGVDIATIVRKSRSSASDQHA
ncbi:sigma 54-interacting transcriptional regulator [Thauera aromatica]|nr:sigma 54-interacting transcriptional regulator [Thauera aromatica]MCK2126858.1 sigma 54-interacting transcriptional regulator [Thauera aromatica]